MHQSWCIYHQQETLTNPIYSQLLTDPSSPLPTFITQLLLHKAFIVCWWFIKLLFYFLFLRPPADGCCKVKIKYLLEIYFAIEVAQRLIKEGFFISEGQKGRGELEEPSLVSGACFVVPRLNKLNLHLQTGRHILCFLTLFDHVYFNPI